MLELFLALIDRVLALAKTRSESNDKWLALITSLHAELIQVHSNYLAFLEHARLDLESGAPVMAVIGTLSERRLEMEAARTSLRAVTNQLAETTRDGPDSRNDFFMQLRGYFDFAARGTVSSSAATSLIEQMQEMAMISPRRVSAEFQYLISRTLKDLRSRFDGVAAAYAAIQAKAM